MIDENKNPIADSADSASSVSSADKSADKSADDADKKEEVKEEAVPVQESKEVLADKTIEQEPEELEEASMLENDAQDVKEAQADEVLEPEPQAPESDAVESPELPEPVAEPVASSPQKQEQAPDVGDALRDKLKQLSRKGVQARQEKHQQGLDKIIGHIKANGSITNKQTEELCGVADSTATKYLQELEDKGLLAQVGSFGPSVKYKLK